MSKTYIGPAYLQDRIAKKILDDQTVVMNTKIVPLNVFVDDIIHPLNDDYDDRLRQILQGDQQLHVLKDYVFDEDFIQAIKNFHIDMHLFNIHTSDLDTMGAKNKDLLTIYTALSDTTPSEVHQFNQLKLHLENHPLKDIYILHHDYESEYEKKLINLLLEHGALYYEEDQTSLQSLELYYANNIRSEVEASAQYLVKHKLEHVQVIPLNDEYLPIIKQVYARYHLIERDQPSINTLFIKFYDLVNVLVSRDEQSIVSFLSSNPLALENLNPLRSLNDFLKFDVNSLLSFKHMPIHDAILNQYDLKHYNHLLEASFDHIEAIKSFINAFDMDVDPRLLINQIFDVFSELHVHPDVNKLANILLENRHLLQQSDDIMIQLEALLLHSKTVLQSNDSIRITPKDQHRYVNKDHVIILGATSKNFPSLKSLKGIIDEQYVKHLNYPSKKSRFEAQLKQYEHLLDAKHLTIFYPLANLDGKAVEPAFSILNFAQQKDQKPQRYPLLENDTFIFKQRSLKPELADELFFKEDHLYGSISSLERYTRCPYSYFLQYGLRIFPQSLPELSPKYMGSVLHNLIETIMNEKMKNQQIVSAEHIDTMIDEAFSSLHFIKDVKVLLVQENLKIHFKHVLNRLHADDEATLFKPIALEHGFNVDINDTLHISGKIDRIDQADDLVRILDYKSSPQLLSATKVKAGEQLQLLTYMLAASSDFNLKPAGVYYVSLQERYLNVVANSVKKSKPYLTAYTHDDYIQQRMKHNQLKGWHFKELVDVYSNASVTNSLKVKDDMILTSSLYNFDTIETVLKAVYTQIYTDLKAGIIDSDPTLGQHTYCDAPHLCHNTHTKFKRSIPYADANLKKELDNDVDK